MKHLKLVVSLDHKGPLSLSLLSVIWTLCLLSLRDAVKNKLFLKKNKEQSAESNKKTL